ncbi:MAG: DNA mismatch endonuclease Vsr [Chloroflexota bacterium]
MSRIRSNETIPEIAVRKFLFANGFRYRKNVKKLPGCPDIVLRKYKSVIFVNGCFWHKHEGCKYFRWPKSNIEYWNKKISDNVMRDSNNKIALETDGWKVIYIWECELKKESREARLEQLIRDLSGHNS